MLTFVEETCLLLLDEKTGEFLPIHPNILECALVGAVLVDLAFAYRIDTDPKTLTVADRSPTGETVLDGILGKIADHPETTDTASMVQDVVCGRGLRVFRNRCCTAWSNKAFCSGRRRSPSSSRRRTRCSTIHREATREIKERMRRLVLSDEIS